METILITISTFISWVFVLTTFVFIDLPLKIILNAFLIVFVIIGTIFYPITKYIRFPRWIDSIYKYATTFKILIAQRIFKLWELDRFN